MYFSRWFSSKDDIRRVANGRRSHSVTMRTLFFVVTFLRTALTPASESSTGFRRKNAEGREITSGAICYSYHLRKLSVWLPDFKNQVFKDPLTFKYHLLSPVEIVNGGFFYLFLFCCCYQLKALLKRSWNVAQEFPLSSFLGRCCMNDHLGGDSL